MKPWPLPYRKLLEGMYPVLPATDLALLFPFSESQIKYAARRWNLTKAGRLTSWRYTDELRLIELFPDHSNAEIARMLGRTESAVMAGGFKLRLRKTAEFHRTRSAKSQFKPGSLPKNKGRKQVEYMSPENIAKTSLTRFRKGQASINEKADGEISLRESHKNRPGSKPYKWIRISKGKWKMLNVHVWEQVHGPVPAGSIVVFRDGDTMNCELENLELITREENMTRNSGVINLPDGMVASYLAGKNHPELKDEFLKHPELISLKRSQINLNRTIKHATKS